MMRGFSPDPPPTGPDYLIHAVWVALAIGSYIAAWRAGKLDEYVYLSLGAFFAVALYWRPNVYPEYEGLHQKSLFAEAMAAFFPAAFYCAWRRGFAWDFVYSALILTILPYWLMLTAIVALSLAGYISWELDLFYLFMLAAMVLAPAIPVWVAWRWWDLRKVIAQAGASIGALAFYIVTIIVFPNHSVLANVIYAVLLITALFLMESKTVQMQSYFILAVCANTMAVSSLFPLFYIILMLD